MSLPLESLRSSLAGELRWDDNTRRLYANDASIYEILPVAVAFPRNQGDCQHLVAFAAEHRITLTARGAGTSLAGQAIGAGIVIDFSRYMNRILALDPAQKTARVEPGVIAGQLNLAAAAYGLCFAPDPSTSDRCSIGGMIGNNAWGVHAPYFGDTSDALLAVTVVLADANVATFQDVGDAAWSAKQAQSDLEGDIYRTCAQMVGRLTQLDKLSPCSKAVPNNMGYALDRIRTNSLGHWNLSKLLCGSEGNLGLITQATVALSNRPSERRLVCIQCPDLDAALRLVSTLNTLQPAAIELVDHTLIKLMRQSQHAATRYPWLESHPDALLWVEFYGARFSEIGERLDALNEIVDYPTIEILGPDIDAAWQLRRAALGLLMRLPGHKKALSFVEDSAVPVPVLAEFVRDIAQLFQKLSITCVYYGSVSRGLIHLRPLLDLTHNADCNHFRSILHAVIKLLKHYGGSISAKHGDGKVRAAATKEILDHDVYAAYLEIKNCFDPAHIFNPGAIGTDIQALSHIRYQTWPAETAPSYSLFGYAPSLTDALQTCNGAGVCRRTDPGTRMCPTFRATNDEAYSTRGRANILRQHLRNPTPAGLRQVKQALSHCLGCKACQTECPASVDLTRLKSELPFRHPSLAETGPRRFLLRHLQRLCSLGSRWPQISNRLLHHPTLKYLLQIHPERHLPEFNKVRFSTWCEQYLAETNPGPQVDIWILNDLFTEYFDSAPGIALVNVLQVLGLQPGLLPMTSHLRVLLSHGALDAASEEIARITETLQAHSDHTTRIIGIEPSELLAYRDEGLALCQSQRGADYYKNNVQRLQLIEEFVAERQVNYFNPRPRTVWYHPHCHQRAQSDNANSLRALSGVPNTQVHLINTGCCGMAGFYGYRKENYPLSKQVAELDLIPAVKASNTDDIIIASGFSCRHQIRDFSDRTALHPAEYFANYISLMPP